MVLRKNLLSLGFYRLSPFFGSDRALNYKIESIKEEDGVDKKGKTKYKIVGLRVITFPGPYNFEHTEDSLKESKDFPFEDASLDAIVEYLNSLPQPELREL